MVEIQRNELYRLGLEYLVALEEKGIKARLARSADIWPQNFGAMLAGNRPFPESKRTKIARCLGLTESDIERLGMALATGEGQSLHMQNVLAKKVLFPESTEPPDLDVFARNKETKELNLVGEGWTLKDNSYLVQFEKIPKYPAHYLFKPKIKYGPPPPTDGGRAEDE